MTSDMDQVPWIAVQRFPYEEPYHTQIEIRAWNGAFGGAVDIYCGVATLGEIGQALMVFPSKVPDEYELVYGSDDPAKRYYRFFRLRVYTTDSTGHCAIQLTMDLNASPPEEGRCCFSIAAEAAGINRLGQLFSRLEGDAGSSFHWTPTTDEFFPENLHAESRRG